MFIDFDKSDARSQKSLTDSGSLPDKGVSVREETHNWARRSDGKTVQSSKAKQSQQRNSSKLKAAKAKPAKLTELPIFKGLRPFSDLTARAT
jgi:hypothetical protein